MYEYCTYVHWQLAFTGPRTRRTWAGRLGLRPAAAVDRVMRAVAAHACVRGMRAGRAVRAVAVSGQLLARRRARDERLGRGSGGGRECGGTAAALAG